MLLMLFVRSTKSLNLNKEEVKGTTCQNDTFKT